MSKFFYPTAFSSWGEEEAEAIRRVLASKQFTMAGEVAAFESELAAYHGIKHAIAVNSGSSANLIAVSALFHTGKHPLRSGDRAIVPALAWPTLYSPLVQHGMRLSLVDTDPTWNMDAERIIAMGDAALIVACPILGNPAHLEWIEARAQRSGCALMVDACESFGARVNGKLAATFGVVNTVSFYHSHQLSAIEGGAVLTDDDDIATMCRVLRNHGWTKGTKWQPPGFAGEYDFSLMGWNVRPVEFHAAIAREQLKKVNAMGLERNKNWLYWFDATAGLPITHPEVVPGSTVNAFGFAFTVKDAVTRVRLSAQFRDNGIDCRPPVGGSFRRHPYSALANFTGDSPDADRIHDTGIFIGNAPFDIADKIDAAVKVMESVL